MVVSLSGLLACSGVPTTPGPAAELDALRQQVAAQATRIALLEANEAAWQAKAAALETKEAALQLTAQARPATGAGTALPRPTPTIVPAVAGLATDGTAKGAATAPVTIIEYTNHL